MTEFNVKCYLQELKVIFPAFAEVQWPSLSLESQYLTKDSWNSGTFEVNFHFQAGHGTDPPILGLSREFGDGWHLCICQTASIDSFEAQGSLLKIQLKSSLEHSLDWLHT